MINFIGIQGYKSIKNCELNLQNINILIGSNGAGKSNFISIFKLLKAIFSGNLQKFILQENADKLLYFGTKHTESLDLKIIFSENDNHNNAYKIQLESTNENGLYISKEASGYNVTLENINHNYFNNFHLLESEFSKSSDKRNVTLKNYINSIEVFHFHDTTNTSALRKSCDINNNDFLIQDGRNLPAYLYLIGIPI